MSTRNNHINPANVNMEKFHHLNVRYIDKQLLYRLKLIAFAEQRSMKSVVIELINKRFDEMNLDVFKPLETPQPVYTAHDQSEGNIQLDPLDVSNSEGHHGA